MSRPSKDCAELSADGWLADTERVESPNHDERPPGIAISLIVIHAISLPPGEFGGDAVAEFFTNRLDPTAHPYFVAIADRRVSAHFFIRRDGAVIQFVPCLRRAWHAGASCWRGRERCNDYSIGIELEGGDDIGFADEQYRSLTSLLGRLRSAFPIEAIAGHADIAPARKSDPGPHFDWSRIDSLVLSQKA